MRYCLKIEVNKAADVGQRAWPWVPLPRRKVPELESELHLKKLEKEELVNRKGNKSKKISDSHRRHNENTEKRKAVAQESTWQTSHRTTGEAEKTGISNLRPEERQAAGASTGAVCKAGATPWPMSAHCNHVTPNN